MGENNKRILMVVTGHSVMEGGKQTGIWLSEYAEPYEAFLAKGYQVTTASILGGKAPIDERSLKDAEGGKWQAAIRELERTEPLNRVEPDRFDVLFLPGGHGTMFDLPGNPVLEKALQIMEASGKLVAAVCHGPAGLVDMKRPDGQYWVSGRSLTSFTDEEERLVKLDGSMPFLLESRLREQGARFTGKAPWSEHVVVDGNLITGQNPQSGMAVARAVIEALGG